MNPAVEPCRSQILNVTAFFVKEHFQQNKFREERVTYEDIVLYQDEEGRVEI